MSNNQKDNRTQEQSKPGQTRSNDTNQGQKDPNKQKDSSHASGDKSQQLPGEFDEKRRNDKDAPKMGDQKEQKTQKVSADKRDDRHQDSDENRNEGQRPKKSGI